MIYADFAYYQDDFGGTVVPEESFTAHARRASLLIDKRIGRTLEEPQEEVKAACCAVTELLYQSKELEEIKESAVVSESTGGWSMSYDTKSVKSLDQRIEEEIELYLNGTGLLSLAVPYRNGVHTSNGWRRL